MPPAPALSDEFLIDVRSIRQEHVSKGTPILVLAVRLERNFFPKDQRRGGMLCIVAVGLALLRAIDAVEADTFRALVVQNFEGVTVEDADGGVVTWP